MNHIEGVMFLFVVFPPVKRLKRGEKDGANSKAIRFINRFLSGNNILFK
jgi:hypothetical protein